MINFIQRGLKQVLFRNLPFTVEPHKLLREFESIGVVKEYDLPVDDFKKSKGYAIVEYSDPANCKVAVKNLDGKRIAGNFITATLLQEDAFGSMLKYEKKFEPRTKYLESEYDEAAFLH